LVYGADLNSDLKIFKFIDKYQKMKKKYKVVKCDCGHIAPKKFMEINQENEAVCPKCYIKFLKTKNKYG
jgi:uncharacterized paraquat-inducible protein A